MTDPKQTGPVPRSEIHEDSITNFDRKAGDSSRGVLVVVLVLAALMLLGIFFLSQPASTDQAVQSQAK